MIYFFEYLYITIWVTFSVAVAYTFYKEGAVKDFFGGFWCGVSVGFIFGLVIALLSLIFSNTIKTASVGMVPKYAEIYKDELVVLGDNDMVYKFKEYSDIRRFQNGGKFYKEYYWKEVFGPDLETMKVTIK